MQRELGTNGGATGYKKRTTTMSNTVCDAGSLTCWVQHQWKEKAEGACHPPQMVFQEALR